MNGQRYSINGIKVTARPIGNSGLFVGIPDDLGEAFAALLSGKLFGTRDIRRLDPETTTPTPRQNSETISQYRQRNGISRTAMADQLNISRRSLGRWESKGKRMSDV